MGDTIRDYPNSKQLKEWLIEAKHPHLTPEQVNDRAAFRCLTIRNADLTPTPAVASTNRETEILMELQDANASLNAICSVLPLILSAQEKSMKGVRRLFMGLSALIAILVLAVAAQAQNAPNVSVVVATCGTEPTGFPAAGTRAYLTVNGDGQLCIAGTLSGGGDGAIQDGVTSSIEATVFDYTNSNPLAVSIRDANGDIIASFGGGTQYTEDDAAAANPVGTAVNLIRTDTPAGQVTTDGDNVAQRGTNYGAAFVQVVSSAGAFVDTFGGGTQYTEGDTDATITGNALLMEVAADTLQPVQGTVADGLLVNLGANNDVTVTGTVTANLSATDNAVLDDIADGIAVTNAGTFATQIDGAALTSLQIIDNVVFGAGTEAAALRVTVATDSTGVLSVDDNGGALTVDNGGTFAVQAAQSGTWTVQPGNTANTTPWLASLSEGGVTADILD